MRDSTRLERSSLVVRGERSELRIEDGCITVTKDATTQAHPTSVTVDVEQVRNVTLERPARGRRGWLHLGVVDGSPAPPTELAAASDPYALPLTSRHVPAARRLARMIGDHVRRRGLPYAADAGDHAASRVIVAPTDAAGSPSRGGQAGDHPPAERGAADAAGPPARGGQAGDHPPAPEPEAADELTERLRELAELHREGALSDAEFQQAKRRVLDE